MRGFLSIPILILGLVLCVTSEVLIAIPFGSSVFRIRLDRLNVGDSSPPIKAECPALLSLHSEVRPQVVELSQGGFAPLGDWWEEHGEVDYGGMVRASNEMWMSGGDVPFSLMDDWTAATAEQQQEAIRSLLIKNGAQWLAPLKRWGVTEVLFRNGVVWGIAISMGQYVANGKELRKYLPQMKYLSLSHVDQEGFHRSHIKGYFAGIEHLVLLSAAITNYISSWPEDLKYLDITNTHTQFGVDLLRQLRGFATDGFGTHIPFQQLDVDEALPWDELIIRNEAIPAVPHGWALVDVLRRVWSSLRVLRVPNAETRVGRAMHFPRLEFLDAGRNWHEQLFSRSPMPRLRWLSAHGETYWDSEQWIETIGQAKSLEHLELNLLHGQAPPSDWPDKPLQPLKHLALHVRTQLPFPIRGENLPHVRRLILDFGTGQVGGTNFQTPENAFDGMRAMPSLETLVVVMNLANIAVLRSEPFQRMVRSHPKLREVWLISPARNWKPGKAISRLVAQANVRVHATDVDEVPFLWSPTGENFSLQVREHSAVTPPPK